MQIQAMIHTHPSDPHSGLSAGDLQRTQEFNVPMFAIGINRLLVGFGPWSKPEYSQPITDRVNVLNGSISIYKDILPILPK